YMSVDYYYAGLMIDWGNPDFGHLRNLMAPGPAEAGPGTHLPYREIGIGLLAGAKPSTPPAVPGLNVGPVLVSQEFGWRSGPAFLTGIVYQDNDGNNFYSPGEGLGGVTIQAVGQHGEGTYQVQTWHSGGYSLALPPGTYLVSATGNSPYPQTTTITIGADNVGWDVVYHPGAQADQPVPGDYDGDGRADLAVYRSSTGQWFFALSSAGPRVVSFGAPGVDIPVPGDYDGDGRTDLAVYRPTTGQWLIARSSAGPLVAAFGAPNLDLPIAGDFDGDGKADLAVYRPSTGQWLVARSSGGPWVVSFGLPGIDLPEPADYDGDGRTDVAVYRPTTGQWLIARSSAGPLVAAFGAPNLDLPEPADYDGDSRADLAVYRPSTGQWLLARSSAGPQVLTLGQPGGDDQQFPADYDGDHVAD
ncbi:MAG: hypothetical protein IRY99_27070, partial [Isosphaeraceae bacterium]|nr:hypothetical protein [Isosphaeraceae bacterium]